MPQTRPSGGDKPRPVPTYRHEALKMEWVDWDIPRKRWQRQHFLYAHEKSFESIVGFYWGFPLLLLILAALPTLATSRRTKPAVWLGVLFAAGLCSELEFIPHYAAPATALGFIIASAGALRALVPPLPERDADGPPSPWQSLFLTTLFTIDLLKPEAQAASMTSEPLSRAAMAFCTNSRKRRGSSWYSSTMAKATI